MKHFKNLFLLFVFATLSLFSFGQKYTGLTATASSGTASMAVDNNMGTRWESIQKIDPQSITVDLGEEKTVGAIKIYWEGANAKDYSISFSVNGTDFTGELFYTGKPQGTRTDVIDKLNVNCRYIKMNGTARNLDYGYSIWEFEVYPPVTPALTSLSITSSTTLITLGKTQQFTVTGLDQLGNPITLTNPTTWSVDGTGASVDANGMFSSTQKGGFKVTATNTGFTKSATIEVLPSIANLSIAPGVSATATASSGNASLAFDNNPGSRWESVQSDPQWIMVNLGAVKNITDVVITWETASSKNYVIEGSLNGIDGWSTIIAKADMPAGPRTDRLYDLSANAQYVRLTGLSRNTGYGHSIYEFRIYGTNANHFRSKTSGNWSDISSWELTTDNVNWADAVSVPTSSDGSVNIQNGHLISINTPATASSIFINPGAKLTNLSTLDVNSIALQADQTGAVGNGTFVDKGTSTLNSGSVEQYLTAGRNWYISSPLAAAQSGVVTNAGNSLWSYDEMNTGGVSNNLLWNPISVTDASLNKMQGYVANVLADGKITFTGGALNTGNKSIVLNRTENGKASRGFNLVGNPYPSYLDWVAASAASTNLGTTMWYRTKPSGYVFATYNASGNQSTNGATQYIPPMQAFWVYVNDAAGVSTTGTLAVTNDMRSHESGTNRMKAPSVKNTAQQVLRIQVSNGTDTDEAVVYFDANASNGYDSYDSPKKSNGNPVPDIYTVVGTQDLAINGLNSLIPNQELMLGFKTGAANTYTIKATEVQNFDEGTKIVLKDNLLNTEQDLTSGSDYSFNSDATTTTSRFSVIFKTNAITTSIDNRLTDNEIRVYRTGNGQLVVNSVVGLVGHGTSVSVYNAVGQKLENIVLTSTTTVSSKTYTSGVYLVSVIANGKTTTRKVVIN